MKTTTDRVANLTERELLDYFADLVIRDRRTTADLLIAIAEVDERKLWAHHACSSMFTFCMERFHMSEQVTAKRLWAARTARRFPVILEMVARGELHLGAIHLLAKHLTDENHATVLEHAKHKSCHEIERLVVELAPRPDVPSRIRVLPGPRERGRMTNRPTTASNAEVDNCVTDRTAGARTVAMIGGASNDNDCKTSLLAVGDHGNTGRACGQRRVAQVETMSARKPIVPLSPRRYKIEITVDEVTHDKLRSLQDLLARSGTGRDPAEIISRAIDVLLDRTLARKAGCTDRAGQACRDQPNPPASAQPAHSRELIPSTFDLVAGRRRGSRSRVIPAAVRREVWRRDSGRCCYVDACGSRCRATGSIEFHHRIPFALGGPSTAENIELRCAAHNQLQADLDFGRSFMDARRGGR